MKLSVIIPVYNVEHTLDRCVESVLGQDVSDMEVILVDDGSTDLCGQMCDDWAERDRRVSVIHQQNMGLSAARNTGLDVAVGEYITFVDSDDYLMPETYPGLIDMMDGNQDMDMVEFGMMHENDRRLPVELHDCVYRSAREYWLGTMAWNHAYACNKIFRAGLFAELRFTAGRLFEDVLLLPDLLHRVGSVATSGRVGYVYCDSPGGISSVVSVASLSQLLRAELHALVSMRTMPWQRNALNLYRAICCRVYDIVRVGVLGIKL